MSVESNVLVTGFPSMLLARRLVGTTLSKEPDTHVTCLVSPKHADRAQLELSRLPAEQRARVELVAGETAAIDFGLAGRRFMELAARTDVVQHCALSNDAGARREALARLNVTGTGEVLELCEASTRGCRLVLWSTASVSGKAQGRVMEGELPERPSFSNAADETRSRAERMVREVMEHVPTTILRPSIIVGDSKTGEIDRMEGPYLLILLMLSSPLDLRVPLPGRGDVPLNLVPIDYVVEAGYAIAADRRSVGRTFHLVDEQPPTARRVFELIAKTTGRPGPVGSLPSQLAKAVLRTPGLERFSHIPRAFLEQLATEVIYDARNASELLQPLGIVCPRAVSYLPIMVDYVREQQAARSARGTRASEPPEDALD